MLVGITAQTVRRLIEIVKVSQIEEKEKVEILNELIDALRDIYEGMFIDSLEEYLEEFAHCLINEIDAEVEKFTNELRKKLENVKEDFIDWIKTEEEETVVFEAEDGDVGFYPDDGDNDEEV